MDLTSLKKTSNKEKKRVGRGISAGGGKTAGRGTKGQNSRAGGKRRPGFEGGQMPLTQRLPKKRGFKARSPKPKTVTLSKLAVYKNGDIVTSETLYNNKLIQNPKEKVKIVYGGEIKIKLKVSVPVSKKAGEKIIAAGGEIEK